MACSDEQAAKVIAFQVHMVPDYAREFRSATCTRAFQGLLMLRQQAVYALLP